MCEACIGEAEDGVLFGSDGEVDQQLLDAELEGRTKTSVRLQEDEDPMDFVVPDKVDDLIEVRPIVVVAPGVPIPGVSVSCILAPDESNACRFGSCIADTFSVLSLPSLGPILTVVSA